MALELFVYTTTMADSSSSQQQPTVAVKVGSKRRAKKDAQPGAEKKPRKVPQRDTKTGRFIKTGPTDV